MRWQIGTETTSGKINVSNFTLPNFFKIQVNNSNVDGQNVSPWFQSLKQHTAINDISSSAIITVTNLDDPSEFIIATVHPYNNSNNAVVNQSTHWDIHTLIDISDNSPSAILSLNNSENIGLSWVFNGVRGNDGDFGGASFDYHFNTLASKIRFIIKFIIYLPFRFYYFFKNYYFLSDKLGTSNTIYIFRKLKN